MFAVALEVAAGWTIACVGEDSRPGAGTPDSGTPNSDGSTPMDASGGDAGVDSAAPDAGPRCNLDADFGTPEPVPGLNGSFNTFTGRVAGSRFYLASDREAPVPPATANPKIDIYVGSFDNGVINGLRRLGPISDPNAEDVSPTESADGLTLYFTAGVQLFDRRLRYVTRQSTQLDYAAVDLQTLPLLVAGALFESDPYLVGDKLYFTASVPRDGGGSRGTLQVVTVGAGGPIVNTLMAVPGSFPEGADLRFPVVNALETELYFSIADVSALQRPFVAKRASKGVPFGAPIELTALEVAPTMIPSSLSEDGCELYLSARDTEHFEQWRARRPPP